jgi:TPR repeat protein
MSTRNFSLLITLIGLMVPPAVAADANNAIAFQAYRDGDYAAAAAAYHALALRGNALAQYNYAMMLRRGEAGSDAWLPWLQRAAAAGVINAAYTLGLAYEHGDGVVRSQVDATRWFLAAAEKGHVDAQVSVATQYFLGRGAPHDEKLAAHWYEKAAEGGDVGAQYLIASMYEHGNGIAADPARALSWYVAAARQGDPAAKIKAATLAQSNHH